MSTLPLPHMVPVQSSNVDAVGYDQSGLHVRFKNGGHYVYQAPVTLYHEALAAKSVGKFIALVRGQFSHRKLV